jgi:hypothetical protein
VLQLLLAASTVPLSHQIFGTLQKRESSRANSNVKAPPYHRLRNNFCGHHRNLNGDTCTCTWKLGLLTGIITGLRKRPLKAARCDVDSIFKHDIVAENLE